MNKRDDRDRWDYGGSVVVVIMYILIGIIGIGGLTGCIPQKIPEKLEIIPVDTPTGDEYKIEDLPKMEAPERLSISFRSEPSQGAQCIGVSVPLTTGDREYYKICTPKS